MSLAAYSHSRCLYNNGLYGELSFLLEMMPVEKMEYLSHLLCLADREKANEAVDLVHHPMMFGENEASLKNEYINGENQ